MTHGTQYGEEYYSFVNGQHTTQGGTHQSAFREAVAKVIKDYFKKDWEAGDLSTDAAYHTKLPWGSTKGRLGYVQSIALSPALE